MGAYGSNDNLVKYRNPANKYHNGCSTCNLKHTVDKCPEKCMASTYKILTEKEYNDTHTKTYKLRKCWGCGCEFKSYQQQYRCQACTATRKEEVYIHNNLNKTIKRTKNSGSSNNNFKTIMIFLIFIVLCLAISTPFINNQNTNIEKQMTPILDESTDFPTFNNLTEHQNIDNPNLMPTIIGEWDLISGTSIYFFKSSSFVVINDDGSIYENYSNTIGEWEIADGLLKIVTTIGNQYIFEYALIDDILTLTDEDGDIRTYTRKVECDDYKNSTDNISFAIEKNPLMAQESWYYSLLNDRQKNIYNQMVSEFNNFTPDFKLTNVTADDIFEIFLSIKRDKPLLFNVKTYTLLFYPENNIYVITPVYVVHKHQYDEYMKEITTFLNSFNVADLLSDFDKLIFVYDYFTKNFTYDYAYNDISYTPLGLLYNKKAVCDGISKMTKIVLDYLNMENIIVHGQGINPDTDEQNLHAWNLVNVDGHYVHLDITWGLDSSIAGYRYDYLGLNDDEVNIDHTAETQIPTSSGHTFNYYHINNMVVDSINELYGYILNMLKKNESHITFKLNEKVNHPEIYDTMYKIAQNAYSSWNKNKMYKISIIEPNPRQQVYTIVFE